MATLTDDQIASVSLKDADSNPDSFAQALGRSFEDYGFAIIADHGIPDALIASHEKVGQATRLPGEGEIAGGPAAGVRPARTGETPVLRSPS